MDHELNELYQQVILDHYQRPRNYGELEGADRRAEGYNPLCGDRINVELKLGEGDRLEKVAFTGQGCAICTAAASMMAESLEGRSRDEGIRLFEAFRELVSGEADASDLSAQLGKLAAFGGVREFPVRVKCAILPWHTFRAALESSADEVTTE